LKHLIGACPYETAAALAYRRARSIPAARTAFASHAAGPMPRYRGTILAISAYYRPISRVAPDPTKYRPSRPAPASPSVRCGGASAAATGPARAAGATRVAPRDTAVIEIRIRRPSAATAHGLRLPHAKRNRHKHQHKVKTTSETTITEMVFYYLSDWQIASAKCPCLRNRQEGPARYYKNI
jgi:hypothetical protein